MAERTELTVPAFPQTTDLCNNRQGPRDVLGHPVSCGKANGGDRGRGWHRWGCGGALHEGSEGMEKLPEWKFSGKQFEEEGAAAAETMTVKSLKRFEQGLDLASKAQCGCWVGIRLQTDKQGQSARR